MSDVDLPQHLPVMVDEATRLLQPERGGTYVDCTVGLGGHTRALLDHGADRVIGFDRDLQALALAGRALESYGGRVHLVHADYRTLDTALDRLGVPLVAGALADLGVSSMQFDAEGRGFSFRRDEPLDMRMDQSQGPTAAERLATVEEADLADVIYQFGEERRSRRVARAIVMSRERAPIETTGQLAAIVRRALVGAGLAADRPGDAHLPGAADLGQRRTRPARRVRAPRRGPAAGRAAGWWSSASTRSRTAS